jgi:membrane AbrB-like protein
MRVGGGHLGGRPLAVQWVVLVTLSVALVAGAKYLRVPAALLVAPMIAAIWVATADAGIRVASWPFVAAQGVIGCMIGHTIPLSVLDDLGRHWPLFLFGIVSVIVAASVIGLRLAQKGVLPGTTAIWGTSPGASTPMIVLSEQHGGDPRIVAVMQQLRIACVIAIAALVAKLGGPPTGVNATTAITTATVWFPPFPVLATFATVALTVGAAFFGYYFRIPAGTFLLPAAVAMTLHETAWLPTELPPWLLALSYALVGWNVGLRFTRPVIAHAFRELPRIVLSIGLLMAACVAIAAVLVVAGGVDPLTAYLATSPGGADTIAIIAMSSNVDVRFVVAMQTARLVVVLVVSPMLSRWVAKRLDGRGGKAG